jgi:ketosteroid isomerase-like protein
VRVVGKPPLGDLARQSAAAFSSRRQTVRTCVATADAGAIEVDFVAKPAVDLPNGWKAGQQVRLRGASFFTIRDGLIAAIRDFR